MIRPFLLALAALLFSASASALNHTLVVNPISPQGGQRVACTNLEHDTSRMLTGASASDYWEGRLFNDHLLYIDQILAAPQTAFRFDALVPDRGEYPNTGNTRVPFVAIVCHPTPATNTDPDYILPGTTDFVPKMQRAGVAPKIAPGKWPLIVYSHGLGGSPVGKGYLQSIALLASQGFVVAAVFHADARFSRLRIQDLNDYWYLLTQYDRVAEMMLLRPVALKAMTDVLLANASFGPAIDVDRIGGFGASLGGLAMANLLGAKMSTSLGGTCRETVRDPRIMAAFTFVPYAGQSFLPAFCKDQSGAEEVAKPFFAMSGTADTTAPLDSVRDALDRMRGSRYLVELEDGQHELRTEDIGDLFTWMLAFYRAYLFDDAASFNRLYSVNGGREDKLTLDVHVPMNLQQGDVRVSELRNEARDQYFLEANDARLAAMLQPGTGWNLTGYSFKAWSQAPTAQTCHFATGLRVGSELYAECGFGRHFGRGLAESGTFFIDKPDATGHCANGLLEINHLYQPRHALNRTAAYERYLTSDSVARDMISNGWVLLPPTMCARP